MESDEFYLTLLSNSSINYFPNNKTTNFITQLPRNVYLDGRWEVGLAEFQYPCSLLTVRKTQNIIYSEEVVETEPAAKGKTNVKNKITKTHKVKTYIETGDYDSVEDLLLAVNSNPYLISKGINFKMNNASRRVTAHVQKNSSIISIRFSISLSLQLGFEPDIDVFNIRTGNHPANVILGLPSHFFIYCDILEPQIVGDANAKLLRVVGIDNSKYVYGAQKTKTFSPVHYIPVLKREFENIEIDLRTDTGENIPFQFGTVCVKLHFRKIK